MIYEPQTPQERLRAAVLKLRTSSMPLGDLIPLLHKSADRLDEADKDAREEDEVRTKLAGLLTGTANALKGPPGPLRAHSWHDLPDVAAAAMDVIAWLLKVHEDRNDKDSQSLAWAMIRARIERREQGRPNPDQTGAP